MRVIKDSQYYTELKQIKSALEIMKDLYILKEKEDRGDFKNLPNTFDYVIKGIENSIEKGYEFVENNDVIKKNKDILEKVYETINDIKKFTKQHGDGNFSKFGIFVTDKYTNDEFFKSINIDRYNDKWLWQELPTNEVALTIKSYCFGKGMFFNDFYNQDNGKIIFIYKLK